MSKRSIESGFASGCDLTSPKSGMSSFRLANLVEGLRKALKPTPEPTRLERRVPHHNVGGDPLIRGAAFETERMVIDRGIANRPQEESPIQTPE